MFPSLTLGASNYQGIILRRQKKVGQYGSSEIENNFARRDKFIICVDSTEYSLRESFYFSQDNRTGKLFHLTCLTRPHQECFDIDKNLNFSPDNQSHVWIIFTSPTEILPTKTDNLVTFALFTEYEFMIQIRCSSYEMHYSHIL